jgi:RNA polymerase sigma factor (sigma-70 family)
MHASLLWVAPMSASPDANHLLTVFQEHYADLLAFLARRLGNVEKAADVAQDTYLRLAGLSDTAQILEPRAFVFKVAGNLAIDRLRQEQRRAVLHADEAFEDEHCDPMASPERSLLAVEAVEQLDSALRQLPSNARLALLLNRLEGLTHAQIARRLGVSESMVGKYIVQAMRHCRDWLRQSECL